MKLHLFKKIKGVFLMGIGALAAVAVLRNKEVREKVDKVADDLEEKAREKFNSGASTLNEQYNKIMDAVIEKTRELKIDKDSSKEQFQKAVDEFIGKYNEFFDMSEERVAELKSMIKNSYEEFKYRINKLS
jgi:nitrate/nitrite-specific signal transduction histidine kinase